VVVAVEDMMLVVVEVQEVIDLLLVVRVQVEVVL
tara:strand:- start:461 stop:562 length:102 start_codon:yes stop_codon:yes gene_type:complete